VKVIIGLLIIMLGCTPYPQREPDPWDPSVPPDCDVVDCE
jgi:hypothetical protein